MRSFTRIDYTYFAAIAEGSITVVAVVLSLFVERVVRGYHYLRFSEDKYSTRRLITYSEGNFLGSRIKARQRSVARQIRPIPPRF